MPAIPTTTDDGQWNQPIASPDAGNGLPTTGSATANDGRSVDAIATNDAATADDVAATNDGRLTHDATAYGPANDVATVLKTQNTLKRSV